MKVSIVTPTYFRFNELPDYFKSIETQITLPYEVVLVDGAPEGENRSEEIIKNYQKQSKLTIKYYRKTGGTAIQRNYGIDQSSGDIILFMDDDVRISNTFIEEIKKPFENDPNKKLGGVTGYRENCYFDMTKNTRWQWYRKLGLLTEYTPGKYDYRTGYPINNNGQAPFAGTRDVDFMTTACTAYRASILKNEVQFDPFFIGYGILEDAHLALSVKKKGYTLLQNGDAKCIELSSSSGRSNRKVIGERTVVNYYYVFKSICGPLTANQKLRFFRYQAFEFFRAFIDILRFRNQASLDYFIGKFKGFTKIILKPGI